MAATFIIAVFLHALLTIVVSVCPNGWTKYDSECYALFEGTTTWRDASTLCREFGGHLASLNTTAKISNAKDFLKYVNHGKGVWIGGSDIATEGMWVWDKDQSPITHTDWARGQPNKGATENCIRLYPSAYQWHDSGCSNKNDYLCERPSA